MIGDPIYSAFRIFFPPDFLYPEVVQKVERLLVESDFPFESPIDYINSTSTTVTLPGLVDPGTAEQVYSQGRKRVFKGGVLPEERITEKSLNLSFELKGTFLNWIILYLQFKSYMDHSAGRDRVFLPNVYAHIHDEQDNVIVEMVYSQISFRSIEPITFSRANQGILPRSFDVKLAFNDYDVFFHTDQVSNSISKSTQY